jgi:uncharacterized protein YbaP (TraB family)
MPVAQSRTRRIETSARICDKDHMIWRKLFSTLALSAAFTFFGATGNAATCCVWRMTNAPAPFYLVGTIHALSSHDYPLPAGYNQALHDSKRLVFEMKPDPRSDFSNKLNRAAVYPKGDDIRRHIHPKTWQILAVNFKNAGFLGRSFKMGGLYLEQGMPQLRPWAIANMFYGVRGYSDVYSRLGVDNHLAFQAKRAHEELAGLESDDEHVEVLRGMNDIESELILLDAIVYRDKQSADYNQMRDAWKRGDTTALWAEHQRFRKLDPGADVRLLDLRNVKWVPRIRTEIKSGTPTSIVVGAAHMLGPNGLISLLQRNGYKFEQL